MDLWFLLFPIAFLGVELGNGLMMIGQFLCVKNPCKNKEAGLGNMYLTC